MNTNFIHCLIILLLLALSAHEAHAAVFHDIEACEVCIHVQSNNDLDIDSAQPYVEFDIALHIKCSGNFSEFISDSVQTAEFIRGPPTFS